MKCTLSAVLIAACLPAAAERVIKVGSVEIPNLAAARDHIRSLEKTIEIIVEVPVGTHAFRDTLTLTAEDSGTADHPITYRAEGGGEVTFDGSSVIPLEGFTKAGEALLPRLCPLARDHVVTIPVSDPALVRLLSHISPVGRLLMLDNDLLTPSRFPNVGFAHAKDLLVEDDPTRWQTKPVRGTHESPNGAIFTLRETPAGTWEQWAEEVQTKREALATGYLSAQWYRETINLHAVDPEGQSIHYLTESRYGLKHMIEDFQSRLCIKYLLCEIDSPGEWYFDRAENQLILWPTSPLTAKSQLVVASGGPFLEISGASHLRFEGFIIQGVASGSAAIDIARGSHNQINGCTIRNSPVTAVNVDGTHNIVQGCDIYDVTRFARLSGGRATPDEITAGGNTIANCHFYLNKLTGVAPGAGISGVGQVFRNNLIHNIPGQAITFSGNDHLIERNELFNIGFEEGDGAAIYSGAQFWGYGTQIKHNFLHHIMSTDGLMTRSGIMLDDHDSGREVIENIFYKTGHGSLAINGGTGLKIHRNIFLHGDYGVWVRIIGNLKKRVADIAKYDSGELPRGDKHDYIWRCERVVGKEGWNKEPWKSRYPTFPVVMNQLGEHGRFWPIENDVDGNLGHGMSEELTYRHPAIPRDRLTFKNTKMIQPDKIFTDPQNLDFSYGIKREDWMPDIPFKNIGLQLDEHRKSRPSPAKYRAVIREHFKDRRSCNRRAKYDFDHVNETIYWNSGALLQELQTP